MRFFLFALLLVLVSSSVFAESLDFEIEGAVPNNSGQDLQPLDEHDAVVDGPSGSEAPEDAEDGHAEVHHKTIPLKYYVSFISVLLLVLIWFSIRMMLKSY
ncbi:hypothetical protein JW968_05730 [Candidatus Woesearchaeota archaeon]|nr:hypothetical protein [Candidatus Woesearchaeota archaeon]